MADNEAKIETASKKLLVTPPPHLADRESVSTIMWTVTATLLPAGAVGVYFFGWRALGVIAVCASSAIIAEFLGERFVLRKKEITVTDGSALLTGVLLAFCLPPSIPFWKAGVGAALAVFIAKTVFGGLGFNIFNPALVGRAVLVAAFPAVTVGSMLIVSQDRFETLPEKKQEENKYVWVLPEQGRYVTETQRRDVLDRTPDAVTGATPLTSLKETVRAEARAMKEAKEKGQKPKRRPLGKIKPEAPDLKGLFFGNVGGCIGETSALALLVGGLWLLWRRIITWHIPLVYIGTVFALSLAVYAPRAIEAGGSQGWTFLFHMGLFQILSGGLFLGAWFMATDMVTSPLTGKGKMIFAAGAGILVVLIRNLGGYPEGVCYSILLMNIAVPLIDRFTLPKKFGRKKV